MLSTAEHEYSVILTGECPMIELRIFLQTGYMEPMLFKLCATVYDAGPTLKQHWVNASCLRVIHSDR